jgi:hypothetical protein
MLVPPAAEAIAGAHAAKRLAEAIASTAPITVFRLICFPLPKSIG